MRLTPWRGCSPGTRRGATAFWEHADGVEITNIDNPGWRLVATGLHSEDGRPIEVAPRRFDRNQEDWIDILAGAGRFEAFCGPGNLGEALHALRAVVEG